MKVAIIGNLPYNINNENIPYFKSAEEKENWIKQYIYDGEYEWLSRPYTRQEPLRFTFKLDISESLKFFNKSLAITKTGEFIEYWDIVGELDKNGKTMNYTATWNTHLNVGEILSNMKTGTMSHGHIPMDKMLGLEYDGGDKYIKKITPITKNDDIKDTPWVYVFTSITEASEDSAFETAVRQGEYGKDYYNTMKQPYYVHVAPLFAIETTSGEWAAQNLLDNINNSQILSIKISKYNPIHFNELEYTEDGLLKPESMLNIKLYANQGIYGTVNYFGLEGIENNIDINTYKVVIPGKKIEQLEGIRTWEIMLENNKVIDVPTKYIQKDEETGEYFVRFTHLMVPTPNECEEYVFFPDFENLRNTETTWENEKEYAYGVNAFDSYKSSSPVSSKLAIANSLIGGFLRGGSLTTFFMGNKLFQGQIINKKTTLRRRELTADDLLKTFKKDGSIGHIPKYKMQTITERSLSHAGKSALLFGGIGAIRQTMSTVINRQDMKRRPNQVKGSGTGVPDTSLNNYSFMWILVEYEYTTSERENLINGVYKNGVALENYVFKNMENIKREKFNVLDVVNMDEQIPTSFYKEYGHEIIENITNFYGDVRRYWHEWDCVLEYDFEEWGNNGESKV